MKKYTLLLLFIFISMNTFLNAKSICIHSVDLIHKKLVGNELYTEKESIRFLKNHTLVYENLLTHKKTIGMWAIKDRELNTVGGYYAAMCFTVEEGNGFYKGDTTRYASGICMDLWEISDPELHYMVGYKTWSVDRTKNNPLYTEYPEDRFGTTYDDKFSKQYFKLRKSNFSPKANPLNEKKYASQKHEKHLANIVKYAKDIPRGISYLKENNLNFKDYSNYFLTRDFGKHITKYNFLNSAEYKYLQYKYPHRKTKLSADGSIYSFNINIHFPNTIYENIRFSFPVACRSKNVSGGTKKICKPSKSDMHYIRQFQKFYKKLGYADEFSKALNNSVKTIFIPKKKKYNYSTPSYKPCGTYDTCHKVIEVINARRIKIECIRGSNTGQIREMCANTHGKWAQGCGFTDIAAHHWKSLGDASKRYCD